MCVCQQGESTDLSTHQQNVEINRLPMKDAILEHVTVTRLYECYLLSLLDYPADLKVHFEKNTDRDPERLLCDNI